MGFIESVFSNKNCANGDDKPKLSALRMKKNIFGVFPSDAPMRKVIISRQKGQI